MLTKKDFVNAAKAFKENQPPAHNFDDWHIWANTIEHMANAFQRMNPKFKRDVFYTACGYSINKD